MIEAQKFCNFIVFNPKKLPKDLILKEQNLRKETDQNIRASYRQVFEGKDRILTIKQFLYDWAPPAYDYPSLWRNAEIATQQESPPPKAFFINNDALWIGKNYRNQNAATMEREYTRIEITSEKGLFSNQELIDLCQSFEPVNPEARKAILNTPFSQLSYYTRHLGKVVSVPTSYWQHQREESLFCFSFTKSEEEALLNHFSDLQSLIFSLEKQGYRLDSIFGFGMTKEGIEEIELLFEYKTSPGSLIRILCTHNPIPFPPELDDQECLSTILPTNRNQNIYYARSKTFVFGQHEMVFKIGALTLIMLIKPAPWTSSKWLQELVRML